MGTMQGWVTRNRLREEQERAKIEQARKEGFDDGYLAGKVFQRTEDAKVRAGLVVALEQARAWVRGDDEPTILLLRIEAALAAAKELE